MTQEYFVIRLAVLAASLNLVACGTAARLPVSAGIGPQPELPSPDKSLIPLVNVVDAKGWPADRKPAAVEGTRVDAFARDLNHPRWIYALPNGDVLVAETNAPVRPDDGKGIKGYFFKRFQKKAGGAVPRANRIILLRDADGDGVADTHSVFLPGLNSPFGMALVNNTLYVANTDAIVKLPYSDGQTKVAVNSTKVVDLPAGSINHHWTKNLIASSD